MTRQASSIAEFDEDPVAADAAAWLVRLQAAPREPAVEASFRAWLSGGDDRVDAFSRATEIWEALGGVAPTWAQTEGRRKRRRGMAASAAAACMVILGAWFVVNLPPIYRTAVGEQRVVRLNDGSAVTLNTASRIDVHFSDARRVVELERGEAYFDVARDTGRPFVVEAGGEQVKALGTTFIVRRNPNDVEVTLLSGIVDVSRDDGAGGGGPVTLSPGQRLRTGKSGGARIDRPQLEQVAAWRHGELLLDDTPLAEAVAEMNRYSRRPIVLETAPPADIHISGVLKVGDSASFARTLASLYGMQLVESRDGFLLRGRASRR